MAEQNTVTHRHLRHRATLSSLTDDGQHPKSSSASSPRPSPVDSSAKAFSTEGDGGDDDDDVLPRYSRDRKLPAFVLPMSVSITMALRFGAIRFTAPLRVFGRL